MPDTINPQQAHQNKLLEALRQQSIREILNVGGVGFGLAAALRGGQGLFNMLSRGGKKLPTRAGVAPLPVKYRPSVDISEAEEEKTASFFDWLQPEGITEQRGVITDFPGKLLAGTAGAYGGWKLMDKLLDQRRRQELDDEVEDARRDFQRAMTSQYKEGSESELGNALDELFGKLHKQADGLGDWVPNFLKPSPDTKGTAMGMYGTYAIPSSILGYLVIKGLTDKGSTKERLEKAQRNRAMKRQRLRPAELYAIPSPIEEEE